LTGDQVTGDQVTGDKVTRRQSDRDKVTGDKVKGDKVKGNPNIYISISILILFSRILILISNTRIYDIAHA
jgi:hypothetical protein